MTELNHAGLDYQGRWPTRQPMAAECCTDLDDDYPVDHRARAIVWCTYLAVLAVAVIAALAAYLPA